MALEKDPEQDGGKTFKSFRVFRGSHRGAETRKIGQYLRNFVGELRRAHCSGVSMSAVECAGRIIFRDAQTERRR